METSAQQAVFLSYASQDAAAAGRIAKALRAAGLEVWFDQSELRGGDAWDRKLHQQIKECALFIAIISRNTDTRLEGYFRREWKLAIDRTHDMAEERAFLLPVVIDDTSDSTTHVPQRFHEVQWTRLPGGENAMAFVQRVQGLFGSVAAVTSGIAAGPAEAPASAVPRELFPRAATAPNGRRLWRALAPAVPRFSRGRAAFVTALAVLAIVVGYLKRDVVSAWFRWAKPDVETILVAQDSQSGIAADIESLGQGIVQNLTDGLCQLPRISLVSQEVVAKLGAQPLDFTRIRNELGADKLLTVRVTQQGRGYEVRVSLVETRTLRHLWGGTYARRSRDVADVVESVSHDVIEALQLRLNAKDRTRLEAFRLYQKGRYYLNKRSAEGLRKAVEFYGQAIQIDPSYAPAHAGIANCYSLLTYYGGVSPAESFPKAREAAQRALDLDETLADAHTALALVLRDYDRAWARAEREFKRAIELNPKYATAHQWYAEYLAALGRHDEAIRVMQRARELAPLEPAIAAVLGWVYYLARRPDDAITELAQTIEREPDFFLAHWFLSLAYAQKGLLDKAIASADTAVKLSEGSTRITADLAALHARSGNHALAESLLNRLRQRAEGEGYLSPYELALVEVGFGRNDRAFDLLNQAVRDRRWEVVNLKVDPMLDPLRNDPRFVPLVRRMGFPD